MPSTWKQSLGRWGEDIAARVLQNHGYAILAQNKHIGHAEIDILAQINEELVFVEVKTRSNAESGFPEEAVDARKLTHLIEAAQRYILEENSSQSWRIDVIAITGNPNTNEAPEILWYDNVAL